MLLRCLRQTTSYKQRLKKNKTKKTPHGYWMNAAQHTSKKIEGYKSININRKLKKDKEG